MREELNKKYNFQPHALIVELVESRDWDTEVVALLKYISFVWK